MKKIRVMVTDDHPTFREGLTRLLSEEIDIEVIATLGNGLQAMESAKSLLPDVAVMDISMPGLSGIETAKQIGKLSPDTAILMVSAYNYPIYVLDSLRVGAAGYLMKDSTIAKIIHAIRMVHAGGSVFELNVTGKILLNLASGKAGMRQEQELHPRELQVLNLVTQGKSNKEIGNQLGISERTVQTHLVNIFRKLQVSSRTEAIIRALKEGWLVLDELTGNEERRTN
ncbi:MAG: response regulator transcription factor [Dehalococcoidales bacterium]|nr:response regulator transcription factor [Dehalococcoidales bacterium]